MRDGDGNTFQQDVVDMIVNNGGDYIDGMGGTGKSTVIKGKANISSSARSKTPGSQPPTTKA